MSDVLGLLLALGFAIVVALALAGAGYLIDRNRMNKL